MVTIWSRIRQHESDSASRIFAIGFYLCPSERDAFDLIELERVNFQGTGRSKEIDRTSIAITAYQCCACGDCTRSGAQRG
jgi:hypothetical protein